MTLHSCNAGNIDQLDGLRGLAALYVVLYHFTSGSPLPNAARPGFLDGGTAFLNFDHVIDGSSSRYSPETLIAFLACLAAPYLIHGGVAVWGAALFFSGVAINRIKGGAGPGHADLWCWLVVATMVLATLLLSSIIHKRFEVPARSFVRRFAGSRRSTEVAVASATGYDHRP